VENVPAEKNEQGVEVSLALYGAAADDGNDLAEFQLNGS
jgi:hypothetical protein